MYWSCVNVDMFVSICRGEGDRDQARSLTRLKIDEGVFWIEETVYLTAAENTCGLSVDTLATFRVDSVLSHTHERAEMYWAQTWAKLVKKNKKKTEAFYPPKYCSKVSLRYIHDFFEGNTTYI